MQVVGSSVYVLTANRLLIYSLQENALTITQELQLSHKSGKFSFEDDTFCLVDENHVKIFDCFDFNGKINLDERLIIYKNTKSPHCARLDPTGQWLAVVSELFVRVFASDTLDCAFEYSKTCKAKSTISWRGDFLFFTDGKLMKSVNMNKNFRKRFNLVGLSRAWIVQNKKEPWIFLKIQSKHRQVISSKFSKSFSLKLLGVLVTW